MGGMGSDDGVGDAEDAFSPLSLELEINDVVEKISTELFDGGVYDAVGNDRKLHGDFGYHFFISAAKKSLLTTSRPRKRSRYCARRFAVTTWYHDRRFGAVANRLRKALGSDDDRAKQTRAAAVGAFLDEGGDVVRQDAKLFEEGAEEGEEGEDFSVAFGVALKKESSRKERVDGDKL